MTAEPEHARPPESEAARTRRLRERAFNVGTLMAFAGAALFDFRIALLVGGLSLAGAAFWGMSRDARTTPRPRD